MTAKWRKIHLNGSYLFSNNSLISDIREEEYFCSTEYFCDDNTQKMINDIDILDEISRRGIGGRVTGTSLKGTAMAQRRRWSCNETVTDSMIRKPVRRPSTSYLMEPIPAAYQQEAPIEATKPIGDSENLEVCQNLSWSAQQRQPQQHYHTEKGESLEQMTENERAKALPISKISSTEFVEAYAAVKRASVPPKQPEERQNSRKEKPCVRKQFPQNIPRLAPQNRDKRRGGTGRRPTRKCQFLAGVSKKNAFIKVSSRDTNTVDCRVE